MAKHFGIDTAVIGAADFHVVHRDGSCAGSVQAYGSGGVTGYDRGCNVVHRYGEGTVIRTGEVGSCSGHQGRANAEARVGLNVITNYGGGNSGHIGSGEIDHCATISGVVVDHYVVRAIDHGSRTGNGYVKRTGSGITGGVRRYKYDRCRVGREDISAGETARPVNGSGAVVRSRCVVEGSRCAGRAGGYNFKRSGAADYGVFIVIYRNGEGTVIDT